MERKKTAWELLALAVFMKGLLSYNLASHPPGTENQK